MTAAKTGAPCTSPSDCLPPLVCVNLTCNCDTPCASNADCLCQSPRVLEPPLSDGSPRTHWPTMVIGSILVLAALTTIISCLAHTIAKKFSKGVTARPDLMEVSTLGDTYGTETLYPTPSPTSSTPNRTPLAPPKMNSRQNRCPSTFNCQSVSCFTPYLLQSTLPVVSCVLAPVTNTAPPSLQQTNHSDEFKWEHIRRYTASDLPSLIHQDEDDHLRFSSQYDLDTYFKTPNGNYMNNPKQTRRVPSTLDIISPKLTSISSNDTFLTANTSTPQENSKYSFHSVMDSSLDSYLTLTLSSPNSSPPNMADSLYPLGNPFALPRGILKREEATPSDTGTPSEHNGPYSVKIDPADREKLENIKKMISRKILQSLHSPDRSQYYVNNHSTFANSDHLLETHL